MEGRAELAHLLPPPTLRRLARDWLAEDCPHFDYGGFAAGGGCQASATLLLKSEGVLAGCPFAEAVFGELGCQLEWLRPEGASLRPVCRLATARGAARHLLLAERVALNVVARAGGIASACRRVAQAALRAGWEGSLAGTRKTTPGFRLVEKYAMLVGGVSSHRLDLSGLIMLKDNHISTAGDISKAVGAARKVGGVFTKIEVESRSLTEAREAALAGADIVMLDNFSPQEALAAAESLKAEFPGLLIEASGGITEGNVAEYFSPHLDIISLGCLTHSYTALDLSLQVVPEPGMDNGGAGGAGPRPGSPRPGSPPSTRRNFAF